MRSILGLDLSLTATGIALISPTVHSFGSAVAVQEIWPTSGDPYQLHTICLEPNNENQFERWRYISDWVLGIAIHADLILIEGYSYGSPNVMAALGELGGIVRYRLLDRYDKGKLITVPPSTLKKFVIGKGVGDKSIMLLETYKRWKISFTNHNICDAFGLAMIGMALVDGGTEGLTKPQLEVIETLTKPKTTKAKAKA